MYSCHFFTFLTFIYMFIRLNLVLELSVGGSRSCTCQEKHAKDMLTLCWRAKYGETVQRIFTSWFAYCIHICFFLIWCKNQEALCKFSLPCFVFFGLAAVVVLVNTANNIQYLWLFLDIQIKYSWKSIIVS